MSQDFDLVAEFRDDQGKGASRRLRREGKVPAILYGGGKSPRALTFEHNRVLQELEQESFYSSVLNIKVGDQSQAVIVKDIQRHPARRQILHMDFQRILEDEEITMNVPIHYLNAEKAIGVKQGGGSVSRLINEVEVTCLPKDLPEYLEVDIENLELNQMLHMSDIKLPPGVEIPDLAQGPEHDQPIVSIAIIKEQPIEEEEEGEVLEAAAEGEAPAEDAEAPAGEDEGEAKDKDD